MVILANVHTRHASVFKGYLEQSVIAGPPHLAAKAVPRFLDSEVATGALQGAPGNAGGFGFALKIGGPVALARLHLRAQEVLGFVFGLGLVLLGVGRERFVGSHGDRPAVPLDPARQDTLVGSDELAHDAVAKPVRLAAEVVLDREQEIAAG